MLGKKHHTCHKFYFFKVYNTVGFTTFFVPIINTHRIDLPFKTYLFDVTNPVQFAIAYFLQIVPVIAAISTDVCLDSTPCACVILTCGQLDLCFQRIVSANTGTEQVPFKDFVRHHVLIQTIVRKVQSTFIAIILPVFGSGLITLCTSTFQLAQKDNTIIEYLFICLLCQTYYFCWFGNELQIQSENVSSAIYASDWAALKPSERKDYYFMMFMGQRELMISYHGQCALTLKTFIWMIKTSYGAFNLLQVSSNEQ